MRLRQLLWGVTAGVMAAACDGGNVIGPENQLEVTNAPDNFQIQATALVDVSQTLSYTWQMSGTIADVNQSGSLSAGSGTLTILDDGGDQVYSRSLAQTGTFQTTAGVAGAWTIRLVLDGASGTINVRVQRP
jgi:hypothetical protein